ncbi:Uncharacterised protein [Vibrio cholerae]|nr:Uncharacterised protein [Vibrio cholerae]CSB85692.1 Uncharacterised protein [Vibrio cholerae]
MANLPSTSISAHDAIVTSSRRGLRYSPVRKRTASRTSTALPAEDASTWFISVKIAVVLVPAPLATATIDLASSSDAS